MTCRRSIEALALLLVVLGSTARADDDGWKARYEAGLGHYSGEDYEGAVREFQAAYAIRPRPRLLFNIGQSYRSLGNAREALRYYLLYQALESNPKPGLKAELEGYIAQMKSIVEEAERARRAEEHELPPSTSPPRSSVAPSSTPASMPAGTPAGTPSIEPRPTLTRAPERRPVYTRGWFWGVVGGAAAIVVVTGLAVGLGVNSGSGYGGDIRHLSF